MDSCPLVDVDLDIVPVEAGKRKRAKWEMSNEKSSRDRGLQGFRSKFPQKSSNVSQELGYTSSLRSYYTLGLD